MKNEVLDYEGNILRLPDDSDYVVFTSPQAAWYSSLVALGALFGAMVGGPLLNAIGHRHTIASTCPLYFASFVILYTSSNTWLLYLSRMLTGIAVGVNSLAVPTYITEVSPDKLRGVLGACNQLCITIGILVVYFLGTLLTVGEEAGGMKLSGADQTDMLGPVPDGVFCDWRKLALINCVPSLLLLILISFIPESPRWLASRGRITEALLAHTALRGGYADFHEERELIYLDVLYSSRDLKEKSEGVRSIFHELWEGRMQLMISILLQFFQQFSGINAMMFFCTSIMRSAKIEAATTISVTVMFEQVIFTALACWLIDKVGRRVLLISSSAIMTIACTVFGFYFFFQSLREDFQFTPLVFASVYMYMAAFSLGVGPIPWLLMGEILPQGIRSTGSSIVTACNWAFAFLITLAIGPLKELMEYHGVMWLFGTCCLALMLFTIFCVPETAGKSFYASNIYL